MTNDKDVVASAMLAALGTALGLITKHGLGRELASHHPEDFERLHIARGAYAVAVASGIKAPA